MQCFMCVVDMRGNSAAGSPRSSSPGCNRIIIVQFYSIIHKGFLQIHFTIIILIIIITIQKRESNKKEKAILEKSKWFWLQEVRKGNRCFGGGGGENTDGNYGNRNAEDKKSHTNEEKKKKKHCTFTQSGKKNRPQAKTFTPAGQTQTLKLADGRKSWKMGFSLLHRPSVTRCST